MVEPNGQSRCTTPRDPERGGSVSASPKREKTGFGRAEPVSPARAKSRKLSASLPVIGLALVMSHRDNPNFIRLESEKEVVWKPGDTLPTDLSANNRWTIWNGKNVGDRGLHGIQEFGSQSQLPGIVVLGRFEQFHLGESME